MLLECFLILCHKRVIRERLRLKKVYPVIRNLDYLQDNEEVSALIYEVVSQLIGNEDPSNPSSLESETIMTRVEEVEEIKEELVNKIEENDKIENHLEDVD